MYPVPALYDLAAQQNIEVLSYPMAENGSMSVMLEGGRCFVGMDDSVLDGSAQERVHLGHELGHCVTGSFTTATPGLTCASATKTGRTNGPSGS